MSQTAIDIAVVASGKEAALADEYLLIRDSGEIPEVGYHGSLYYLCEDPAGPGLHLTAADLQLLRQGVIARYRAIIMRDLTPANRSRPIYRGLARAIVNWRRLILFAGSQACPDHDVEQVRAEVASTLLSFLRQELADLAAGGRSCVNCRAAELLAFAMDIGLAPEQLPQDWERLVKTNIEEK